MCVEKLQASQEKLAGYELSKGEDKSMWQLLVKACQERLDGYLQEVSHTLHGRMKDRWLFLDSPPSLPSLHPHYHSI